MLDNREIAALVWLTAAMLWVLSRKELRTSVGGIFKVLVQPLILIPLLATFAYVGLEVWVGSKLSLWHPGLAKGTVLWVVGSAAVLFFNCTKVAADPRFFRHTLAGTIGVAVFVEFFMNLYVMSLPAELVLQPVVVVLSLTAVVGDLKPEHRSAKIFCEVLLALIGFALLFYTIRQAYLGWDQIGARALLLEFALPVWLTAGFLPFLYLLSFYVVYDTAFKGINWATKDRRSRWRARLALVTALHLRTRDIHRFTWNWAKRATEAPTFTAARELVGEFREELRRDRQAKIDEEERIRRYTGSNETDGEGRRLDRREFKETVSALRSLGLYQMGWYRNHGGRYKEDLLVMLGNDLTSDGLPKDSGVTLSVAEDGQAWYAWRCTVTGWCFAVGAAGPPPDQWEYDGPQPPQGFPGKDPAWGDRAFSDAVNRNWM